MLMQKNDGAVDGPLLNKGEMYYNENNYFWESLISAGFFTLSMILVRWTSLVIHYSIDTIYVALGMTLVIPSFILGDYSANPAQFAVNSSDLVYYFVGGVLTFCFHSCFHRLMSLPSTVSPVDDATINSDVRQPVPNYSGMI